MRVLVAMEEDDTRSRCGVLVRSGVRGVCCVWTGEVQGRFETVRLI